MVQLALLKGDINIKQGWQSIWSALTSGAPGLATFLTTIGALIFVWAIVKFFWDKRKGNGGNTSALGWSLAVAALFAGPQVVLPILLGMADWVINTVIGILPK